MAHSNSAKKRIRQNLKSRARNRWRKGQLKDAVKAVDEALHEGDQAKAGEALKQACKTLDSVASRGTIHKNQASRTKSRLNARVKKAFAAPSEA